MIVAEGGELVDGAADVQRAGGFEGGHQHGLFRAEDLRRLPHEPHPGHYEDVGLTFLAEAGHLQTVPHKAPALGGQFLQLPGGVVVGHKAGVLGLQQTHQFLLKVGLGGGIQRRRRRGTGQILPHQPGVRCQRNIIYG